MKNNCWIIGVMLAFLSTAKIASACNSSDVDIAETSLRIVLDQPTDYAKSKGIRHMSDLLPHTSIAHAFLTLLNIEQRSPGLLQGKCDFGFEWAQYDEVQSLFRKAQKKYEL